MSKKQEHLTALRQTYTLKESIDSVEAAISKAILEHTSLRDALNLEIQAIMREAYDRGIADATRIAVSTYKSLETKG